MPHKLRPTVFRRPKAAGRPGTAGGPRAATCARAGYAVAVAAAATLLAPPPAAAAAANLTLGPSARVALPGCDNPTPVRGTDGAVYSNASDCSVGGSGKLSTGWVRLSPDLRFVPSGVTARGDGARGLKLSGAIVEGGTLYLLERNLTSKGGMRLGRSASISQPSVTWTGTLPEFGWGSFAQGSPDGYEYVYFRDVKTAYGTADRVAVARVPKGKVADLSSWQVFAGNPGSDSWLPWAKRAARKPVLVDNNRINRPHVSHIGQCWVMAVTMPPTGQARGGNGLAVYTSSKPTGPWARRYYAAGVNLGESAQFSPYFSGTVLLTHDDHFEWRQYSMPGGC